MKNFLIALIALIAFADVASARTVTITNIKGLSKRMGNDKYLVVRILPDGNSTAEEQVVRIEKNSKYIAADGSLTIELPKSATKIQVVDLNNDMDEDFSWHQDEDMFVVPTKLSNVRVKVDYKSDTSYMTGNHYHYSQQ